MDMYGSIDEEKLRALLESPEIQKRVVGYTADPALKTDAPVFSMAPPSSISPVPAPIRSTMMPSPKVETPSYREMIAPYLQEALKSPASDADYSKARLGLGLISALGPRSSASDTFHTLQGPIYTGTPKDEIDRQQKNLREIALSPLQAAQQRHEMSVKAVQLLSDLEKAAGESESREIMNKLHGLQMGSTALQARKTEEEIAKSQEANRYTKSLRTLDSPESMQLKADANDDINSMAKVAAENYGKKSAITLELQSMASRIQGMTGEQAQKEWNRAKELYQRQTADYAAKTARIVPFGSLNLKHGFDEEKRQFQIKQLGLANFTFLDPDNAMPTANDKVATAKAAAATTQILSLIRKLRDKVEKSGLSVQGKAGHGKDLEQLYQDIIVKTKELDALGALSGADIRIEEGKVPNPTDPVLYGESKLAGPRAYLDRLDALEGIIIDTTANLAMTRGYDPTQFIERAKLGDLAISTSTQSGGGRKELPITSEEKQKLIDFVNKNPTNPKAKAIKAQLGI